jgi:hypothetical protein
MPSTSLRYLVELPAVVRSPHGLGIERVVWHGPPHNQIWITDFALAGGRAVWLTSAAPRARQTQGRPRAQTVPQEVAPRERPAVVSLHVLPFLSSVGRPDGLGFLILHKNSVEVNSAHA